METRILNQMEKLGWDHAKLASFLGSSINDIYDLIYSEAEYTTLNLKELGRLLVFLDSPRLDEIFEDPNEYMGTDPEFLGGRSPIETRRPFVFDELSADLAGLIKKMGTEAAEDWLGWRGSSLLLARPLPMEEIDLLHVLEVAYSFGRDWRDLAYDEIIAFARIPDAEPET